MTTLPTDASSLVELVIEGRARDVGSFAVARLLPSPKRRMVGPFIFIDHMGPVTLAPGAGFDVKPHPHIGLSTVTYMLAGENVHRDSLGTVLHNRPGDINLMTAGRGIVHSERADPAFRASGGAMEGVQIWLALPDANEDQPPSFEHHAEATLPIATPAAGVRARVLLGTSYGARSPIEHPSAPQLVDLHLDAGACVELPAEVAERALFVIAGTVRIGELVLARDQLAVLAPGAPTPIVADAPTRALMLGGPPLGPRFIDWNFVASTRERIDRAREAWKAGAFPVIPTDAVERVPYPELHH